MDKSKIAIILSTYNGEKFLDEQLLSLKNQTFPFQLFIRDDGSTDNTIKKLYHWKDQFNVKIVEGENLGALASFNLLLQMIPSDCDYILFCDQDDIWENNKIENTVLNLQEYETKLGKKTPLLFHSDLILINENSNIISNSFWRFQRIYPLLGHRLNRLLVQNTVTGCSAGMNRTLFNLIGEIPAEAKMHDWWVALIACSFGKIISSGIPLIRYRIHRSNAVGGKTISFKRIFNTLKELKLFYQNWKLENENVTKQVNVFSEKYQFSLPTNAKLIIDKYLLASASPVLYKKFLQFRFRFFQHGWYRVIISFLLF